jgi:hypothetical protein
VEFSCPGHDAVKACYPDGVGHRFHTAVRCVAKPHRRTFAALGGRRTVGLWNPFLVNSVWWCLVASCDIPVSGVCMCMVQLVNGVSVLRCGT